MALAADYQEVSDIGSIGQDASAEGRSYASAIVPSAHTTQPVGDETMESSLERDSTTLSGKATSQTYGAMVLAKITHATADQALSLIQQIPS